MARSPLKSLQIPAATGRMIARLIQRVERTSQKVFDPEDLTERLYGEHPAIIAFWHGQFMMISTLNTHGVPVKAMVARHGDADLIGNALSELGVDLIRGPVRVDGARTEAVHRRCASRCAHSTMERQSA